MGICAILSPIFLFFLKKIIQTKTIVYFLPDFLNHALYHDYMMINKKFKNLKRLVFNPISTKKNKILQSSFKTSRACIYHQILKKKNCTIHQIENAYWFSVLS